MFEILIILSIIIVIILSINSWMLIRLLIAIIFWGILDSVCVHIVVVLFLNKCCLKISFNPLNFMIAVIVITLMTMFFLIPFIAARLPENSYRKQKSFKVYGNITVFLLSASILLFSIVFFKNSNQVVIDIQDLLGVKREDLLPVITLGKAFIIYIQAINHLAFLFYGWDKIIASIFPKDSKTESELNVVQVIGRWFGNHFPQFKPDRVPEWILHWQSILGGTIGATAGQYFFRHKTQKTNFQSIYKTISGIQIMILVIILIVSFQI